jgi:hypothetical protein
MFLLVNQRWRFLTLLSCRWQIIVPFTVVVFLNQGAHGSGIACSANNPSERKGQLNEPLNSWTQLLIQLWMHGSVATQLLWSHVFQVGPQQRKQGMQFAHLVLVFYRNPIIEGQGGDVLTNTPCQTKQPILLYGWHC